MCEKFVVAVTGSRGFLGSHLVKSLKKRGICIIEIDVTLGVDVLSIDDLERVPHFDALIHLAARTYVPDSYTDSRGFYETNILGTLNCLEICKRNKANMIFASTYVYGNPSYLPVDECHPTSLWNPYATSKVIAEELCTSYSQDFGLSTCILRIFNMYGPRQNPHFLIPTIIDGVLNERLCLDSSWPKRDYVYVLDVVAAIERCLNSEWCGIRMYNVGSGVSYSVAEVVDLVKEILKTDVDVVYRDLHRNSEVANVVADISKIGRELSWSPRFDLETGLQHCVSSWSSYGKT